jgi:glycosyltransferase involved in cell wall biosynthesis
MKIVIIHNLYEPYSRGGAEQVVKTTIDFLLSQGYKVVFITSTPGKNEILEENNLKIYHVKQINIFIFLDLYKHSFVAKFVWHLLDIFNFGIARKISKILQTEKPDVVHTHNLMGLSLLIPFAIRKSKIKHIHTVHDVQLVEPSGIILVGQEKKWRYAGCLMKMHIWIMKKLVDSPEIVISPSKFLLNFYKERGFFSNSSLEILANPLTLNVPKDFEKENHEVVNFLYLGQVEEHKGIVMLLENFTKIKNANLHVVGDGSLLEGLKEKFANLENVKFYGRQGREELPNIFAKIDVTIFPSICYENYPSVIFESLSFGVPVLSANHSALLEFIEENKNGWLFDISKENDLYEKIQWCIKNKTDIKSMSDDLLKNFLLIKNNEYFEKLLRLFR